MRKHLKKNFLELHLRPSKSLFLPCFCHSERGLKVLRWLVGLLFHKQKGSFVKGWFWRMCPHSGRWESRNINNHSFLLPGVALEEKNF